jgi:ABC-2 type transport system permease protein
MIWTLVTKSLRDLRVALLVMLLLLGAFQCLWARVTKRISSELMPQLLLMGKGGVSPKDIENTIFSGPGRMVQMMMGGEKVSIFRVTDMLSVGYVHALMVIMLSIWAVGRAAAAITGEIDRGTMELLLAQPVPRRLLIAAHFLFDLVVIPLLCLGTWFGNALGIWLVDLHEIPVGNAEPAAIAPFVFGPGLVNVGALLFAISGYTMWLSAGGRFRGKVLGIAVLVTLLQFLVNVIGQLWSPVAWLRPLTVFFYYQPQQIMLQHEWSIDLGQAWNYGKPLMAINVIAVLGVVGLVGYAGALWTFTRRDLPAPL